MQYVFSIKPDAFVNGYYVEYREGYIVLGLKQPPQLTGADLQGAVILLDAGHGGSDGGASGPPKLCRPLGEKHQIW